MDELKSNPMALSQNSISDQGMSSTHSEVSQSLPCLDTDLICLSHLRWNFVFQRPQHLMTRFARHRRVFFIEEPIFGNVQRPYLSMTKHDEGLFVVVPHLPTGISAETNFEMQRSLIDDMLAAKSIDRFTLWYYTPMALSFTEHLEPEHIIYDCMDELSAFKGAPRELLEHEKTLFSIADLVFTGGHSLYEVKRDCHPNVHAFPSSIDFKHFASARAGQQDPADQAKIPHPRVGFYGVIDERADLKLLEEAARLRPDWHFIMLGPIVKIDPASLPKHENIHYLGMKSYQELPSYLAHWDLAMMPFAMNESTRFISPTKTPEYLAAGCPVVSTPIRDVVRPYGDAGLVHIAATAKEFVERSERAMKEKKEQPNWMSRVDAFLKSNSWDLTWKKMAGLEKECVYTNADESMSDSETVQSIFSDLGPARLHPERRQQQGFQ